MPDLFELLFGDEIAMQVVWFVVVVPLIAIIGGVAWLVDRFRR